MAARWAAQVDRAVTVITLSSPSADFFDLPGDVARISLGSPPGHGGFLRRLSYGIATWTRLRTALKEAKPHVIISFIDLMNVGVLLSSFGLGTPTIVSERTDPRVCPVPWTVSLLRFLLYRRAATIVVQTQNAAIWARRHFPRSNVRVIPNAVTLPSAGHNHVDQVGSQLPPRPAVVSIGRLGREKGFDLLIRAFADSTASRHQWHLVIAGEGPERANLEHLAASLGVRDRVSLPGITRNVAGLLGAADLFVLASRYEGFPNALLEAMAVGVACVSTACPSGPSDIIRDGYDGLLVVPDDAEELAEAMSRLIGDEQERGRLAGAAPDVLRRFSTEQVMAGWDKAIDDVLGDPPGSIFHHRLERNSR